MMKYSCLDTNEVVFSYEDYLQTIHWRRFREEIFEERNKTCESCKCDLTKTQYNIHHKNYRRVGKENKADVMLLCLKCHTEHHDKKNKKKANVNVVSTKEEKITKISGLCYQLTNEQIEAVLKVVESYKSHRQKKAKNTTLNAVKFKRIPH